MARKREELQAENFNPVDKQADDDIQAISPGISRFKLQRFALDRARKIVIQCNRDWAKDSSKTATIDKISSFRANLDYIHDLESLVKDFLRAEGKPFEEPDTARDERIAHLQAEYASKNFFPEEKDLEFIDTCKPIDRPVAPGGLTKLHVAAQSGNMVEVRRLIEQEGARAGVKCNGHLTARERAMAMNHIEIAQYLVNFS